MAPTDVKKAQRISELDLLVAGTGIEPVTRGFSRLKTHFPLAKLHANISKINTLTAYMRSQTHPTSGKSVRRVSELLPKIHCSLD